MKSSYRFVKFLEKMFPQRFLVARLTKYPIIRPIMKKFLFQGTEMTYLPLDSVVEITVNKEISAPPSMVLPSQVVEHFIRKAQFRFIMNFCLCREAMSCKNHPKELGCVFLGESARRINQKFGREATVDEALAHVKRCREAGLVHMIGRDRIDEVWLGVGAGKKLMTICSCCDCCCLWKMTKTLDSSIGASIKKMPGVIVQVNTEKCVGCGQCVSVCFVDAIGIVNGISVIGSECRGCGRCADVCPQHAISVRINDLKFLEKTIKNIEAAVDVM